MANEIKLITFADSEVTATDDAYVYETATGSGGVINGCVVTIKNASELHITGGNGILCGRKFTIFDSDIPVTLSPSGTLLGRLYIHMDLSNASTPIQLMIETGASLTPVQQDADVNATNGVYEINLATFDVDTSTISNLVDVAPKAEPHEVLNTVADCLVSTNPGDIAGASCIAELNSNIGTWVEFEITPHTGFTAAVKNGYYNATLGLVRIEFQIYGGSSSASDSLGTIPAQYRPTQTRGVGGSIYTNAFIPTILYIASDGTIKQIATSSNISQCICTGIYSI